MKKIALIITMTLILASCSNSNEPIQSTIQTIVDSELTSLPEPTETNFSEIESSDVFGKLENNQYKMNFELDTEKKRIKGVIEATIINDSDEKWQNLCFRDYVVPVINQYELDIKSETHDDIPDNFVYEELSSTITSVKNMFTREKLDIETSQSDKSVIYIMLETPLEPGNSIELEMNFEADIPLGRYRYSYFPFENEKISFEMGNFYPILAVYEKGDWITEPYLEFGECFYSKCADYEVTVKAPEDYIIIASGKEQLKSTDSGISTWHIQATNMRDFTFTASNNLKKISQTVNGIIVNSYYFDETKIKSEIHEIYGNIALGTGLESIEFFGDTFGEYPYDEIDIVPSYFQYGGMEYPSFVRISIPSVIGFIKDTSGDWLDFSKNYTKEDLKEISQLHHPNIENVVAHEIAHQWFYAVVGNNQFAEAWLDEGFATFATSEFMATILGENEPKLGDDIDQPIYLNLPINNDIYNESTDRGSYANIVYTQGKIFLYRLKQAMGEPAFNEMIKNYYTSFMFKEATTKDFLTCINYYAPNNVKIDELLKLYFLIE